MLSRPAEVVNLQRVAGVLRWASRIMCARARSPSHVRTSDRSALSGCLPVLRCGTGEGEAFVEIAAQALHFYVGCLFLGHGGLGNEKQL
jgi:hypothetical protein